MEITRRKMILGAGGGLGVTGVGGAVGYRRLVADGEYDPPELFGVKEGFRIGVIGDPHWRPDDRGVAKGIGSSAIVDSAELRRNLDTIATDMREQFEADMVVQLGDLADGFGSWGAQRRWLSEALDYLENDAGGDGIETIYHLLGNHEYKLVPVDDRQDMYDVFGWGSIEDSFRHIEVAGVNILLLNTAYSETHSEESVRDHAVPEEQLDWLDSLIPEIEGPVVTFSHIALTEGSGTAYDTVEGKETLLKRLHELDYRLGVFGHSHHADSWDQVRRQIDAYGTSHIHVPTPNLYKPSSGMTMFDDVLHVDYETVPYLKIELYDDGGWLAQPSYGGKRYSLP